MDGEGCLHEVQDVAVGCQHERQVLEVVSLSGVHLERLINRLPRVELDSASVTRQGEAVHQHFRTIRVGSIDEHEFEDYVVFKALLRLVAHPDMDDRRLVTRDIRYIMVEYIELRVFQLEGTVT